MDKELIEDIASKLKQHQAPYADGAWERFLEKDKKKRGFVYWPIWSAAAILLLVGGLYFTLKENGGKETKQQVAKNSIKMPPSTAFEKNIKHSEQDIRHQHDGDRLLNRAEKTKITKAPAILTSVITNNDSITKLFSPRPKIETVIASANPINIADSSQKMIAANSIVEKQAEVNETKKTTFEEILARDSKNLEKTTAKKVETKSKWQPGVFVGSAIGNDNKVKMNYGFSLSYHLADKISINSGIAYNALSATENTAANRPQSLSDRSLASVNANLQGINIPLEVKYNFTDKFYSGVGVSALAVLNNRQENSYLVNQVQQISTFNDAGIAENKTLIVTQRTTEPASNTNDLDKYIGFYNFSLGYKQKVAKKLNVAVEPFLRLPMKTFSNDRLNLTNGGLRLKFDF